LSDEQPQAGLRSGHCRRNADALDAPIQAVALSFQGRNPQRVQPVRV
jgi:hypothetical protein